MAQGVTATEFTAMCQKRMPWFATLRFPVETTQPFLDRCCEVGLLRRENQNGTTRYFPTQALFVLDLPD